MGLVEGEHGVNNKQTNKELKSNASKAFGLTDSINRSDFNYQPQKEISGEKIATSQICLSRVMRRALRIWNRSRMFVVI